MLFFAFQKSDEVRHCLFVGVVPTQEPGNQPNAGGHYKHHGERTNVFW